MTKDTQDIVNTLLAEQAAQGEKIQNIKEDCQEIKSCLLGNGKPGLVLRTDRLEQKDNVRAKMFWTVLALVAAICVKSIAGLFTTP